MRQEVVKVEQNTSQYILGVVEQGRMAFRNVRRGVLRQFKITGSTFEDIPELGGVSVWGWGFVVWN